MVMSMYGLLAKTEAAGESRPVTDTDIENHLHGNLCRCTGYRGILNGFSSIKDSRCCGKAGQEVENNKAGAQDGAVEDDDDWVVVPGDDEASSSVLSFDGGSSSPPAVWFSPSSLDGVMQLLQKYSLSPTSATVRLVAGNTAQGVEKYYNGAHYGENTPWQEQQREGAPQRVYIYVGQLPELLGITVQDSTPRTGEAATSTASLSSEASGGSVTFGAAVTLSEVRSTLSGLLEAHPQYTNLRPLVHHLGLVAHTQVRDVGSWAGNVMLAKVGSKCSNLDRYTY
jgi:xanthine dehydrogenase iron-sulfur cluster and FAD-binding subunit A